MKNYIILFFLLLNYFLGFSQNETTTKYNNIETTFFYGKLIEHDKALDNAIQGDPFGFIVSWNTINPNNSEFNSLYNFPERGYSFLYENFNSDILGEVYGGYRHFTYNLNPAGKNHLKLTSAFGLGYATKAYHPIMNPENFAHGSKMLVSAFIKLQYITFFQNKKISLTTGASLIHFSNISFKNPNLGINTISLNLGINYKLNPVQISPSKDSDIVERTTNPINYNLILRGGYNESLKTDSGLYPFYTVTFYGSKTLNNYSTITTGIDYFNSKFLQNYIRDINFEETKNYNENDYKRIGIFVGHELTQNNFSLISQIGYTIYYPFPYVSRIYERFGFKYNLSKHLFSEVTMKVNLFRAEALELGIGYKF